MKQKSFAGFDFDIYRKKTRKEEFLDMMDEIIPWDEMTDIISPYYPAPVGPGRRPIGIKKMLKIYFLQKWYNISDPTMEESLYDSHAMKKFVGIDLGNESAPDESTILKFRHLLEERGLGEKIFEAVNKYLGENGIRVSGGTIVDATIIHAPTSTKNQEQKRDSEMSSTKKGNKWYFGMKSHIGVDSKNQLIHSMTVTTASVHDSQELAKLLHGQETRVYGDKAYTGQKDKIREKCIHGRDFTLKKSFRNHPLTEKEKKSNRIKNSVRALVEYPFLVMKRIFGFEKVRYRGLYKNENHLYTMFALINLYIQRRHLLALTG